MTSLNSCFLCKNNEKPGEKLVQVTEKGLQTLKSFSRRYGDNKFHILENQRSVLVHEACRKSYTDTRKLKNVPAVPTSAEGTRRRSSAQAYDTTTQCLFCLDLLPTIEEIRKNPSRHQVSTATGTESLRAFKDAAAARDDEWSRNLQDRLLHLLAGVAKGTVVRYHRECQRKLSYKSSDGRPVLTPPRQPTSAQDAAFYQLCAYIKNSAECQFALSGLSKRCVGFGAEYSEKQLLRRLMTYFGSSIVVHSSPGVATVISYCGSEDAHKKLIASLREPIRPHAEEEEKIVLAASSIIKRAIRRQVYDVTNYPVPEDVHDSCSEKWVPKLLHTLIQDLVCGKKAPSELALRKMAAIEHGLISACRPRSFISPLHLDVSIFIHRRFGTRELIDLMHSLSQCLSYAEVSRYETRAASIISPIPPGLYIQFGFDNADFNTGTIDGKNTIHMMGGIMMMTPSHVFVPSPVPRKVNEEDAKDATPLAERAFIPVVTYQRGTDETPPTIIQDLQPLVQNLQSTRVAARHQDAVWLCGPWLEKNFPGWHGFMKNATNQKTDFSASDIQALPFVDQNPSDPSTIYSTLLVASEKCREHGQKHGFATYDLPLYVKAKTIVDDRLNNIIPRLGGFHLLMSFMGAAGSIMNGSGIQELWNTVYAENSIPKMLGGHAYSRALRAHILTRLALITMILREEDVPLAQELHMQNVFTKVVQNEVSLEEISADLEVAAFSTMLDNCLKRRSAESRTGKLWVQYIRMVELMCDYIRSERSGNWNLQLATYEAMLPFFHAAGHLNYAKAAHMHLQDMLQLEKIMDKREFELFTTLGYFTIRRVKKIVKFWEGVPGDMTIEQWFMKAFKAGGGGLTKRGNEDTTVAKWLHSLHSAIAHITNLQDFCGLSTARGDQHVEMRDSRKKTDTTHLKKLTEWLRTHSPFTRPPNLLVSLSTGIVGGEEVNCDCAEEVGRRCISEMVGNTFEDLHLKRKDKVIPLGSTGKTVKIADRDVVVIDSMQLFHRIICVVKDEADLKRYFSFELAPTPLSLFDDSGFSRKGTKSNLVPALIEANDQKTPPSTELPPNPQYTIDGGYLLHKVIWSTPTNFREISDGHIAFVKNHYRSSPVVVFDGGYEGQSTKDEEHLRRKGLVDSPEIVPENGTLLTISKAKFLAHRRNKALFLKLLAKNLRDAHIKVIETTGDADHTIVSTAIRRARAQPGSNQVVVGEDTDLFALLIAHAPEDANVYWMKPGKDKKKPQVFTVRTYQEKLGPAAAHILFLHAASGCDTTSAPFGKGKKPALTKLIKSSSAFKEKLEVFNQPNASHEAIAEVGEAFMLLLYGAPARFQSLNDYRFFMYLRTVVRQALSSQFNLASLPPTKSAAIQFFYRVYLQVQAWRGRALNPTLWGFKEIAGHLRPVWTTENVAPPELLKLITCSCRGMCDTQKCGCLKAGLRCSSVCGYCQGHSCYNRAEDEEEDDDDDVDDPL